VKKQPGGVNADREYVRLRGRLRIDDPVEKERRRQEFEAYRRKLRIEELRKLLEETEREAEAARRAQAEENRRKAQELLAAAAVLETAS
jgi:hypothetical protein